MDRRKSLDTITNSFYAADKIRDIMRQPLRENRTSSILESNYSMVLEILKVINEYSPGVHKETLNSILEKGNLYGNTYKNLKTHVNSNRSKGFDLASITETLAIIKPALNNRNRTTVEKILKIYEIINS